MIQEVGVGFNDPRVYNKLYYSEKLKNTVALFLQKVILHFQITKINS